MKVLLTALVALLGTVSGSARAETGWDGMFLVDDKAGTCPGNPVGLRAAVRFRPEVGDNPPGSLLTIFYPNHSALSLELADGNFDNTAKAVTTTSLSDFTGPGADGVTVKFTSIEPALSVDAPYYEITGEIDGVDGPGCIEIFRMPLLGR